MIHADVVIVGGGPAGAACAWQLRRLGAEVIILDRAVFPRAKLCAGWIQPEVLRDLELDPNEYPHSLTTFRSMTVSISGLKLRIPTRQYAIRRLEFDQWLLKRAAVPTYQHTVREIRASAGGYTLDAAYYARYLVGAGGTHCPVYRTLFQESCPRHPSGLILTQEQEFPYTYTDDRCQLWFFENGLPGYAWYVPKSGGHVNVGIGGKAEALRARSDTIKAQWDTFTRRLERLGLVRSFKYQPEGHAYYLRAPVPFPRIGDALITGDAAGLATLDMGEGIGPAIQSGLLAAESIAHNTDYSLSPIRPYSIRPAWLPRLLLGPAS